MQSKSVTFKYLMFGLAVVFGAIAATKLIRDHDLYTGLWSFAVCFALVLGLLPAWLTSPKVLERKVTPEKYTVT
jgi:predicted MFS family arabinose efflux permease